MFLTKQSFLSKNVFLFCVTNHIFFLSLLINSKIKPKKSHSNWRKVYVIHTFFNHTKIGLFVCKMILVLL